MNQKAQRKFSKVTDIEMQKLELRNPLINFKERARTFAKSKQDKADLQTAKLRHNKSLRDAGFDPKKRMNLSAPQHIKVKSI